MPIATSATTRTGVHQDVPSRARRPTGPPISSLPAAATSSSLVGRTGSGSCTLACVDSALGMPHILPYVSRYTPRVSLYAEGRRTVQVRRPSFHVKHRPVSRETPVPGVLALTAVPSEEAAVAVASAVAGPTRIRDRRRRRDTSVRATCGGTARIRALPAEAAGVGGRRRRTCQRLAGRRRR